MYSSSELLRRTADEFVLHQIFSTEVLSVGDERHFLQMFKTAKETKVDGLLRRKFFETLHQKNFLKQSNILGGRFTLSLKHIGIPNENAEARYIAQGHEDVENTS